MNMKAGWIRSQRVQPTHSVCSTWAAIVSQRAEPGYSSATLARPRPAEAIRSMIAPR